MTAFEIPVLTIPVEFTAATLPAFEKEQKSLCQDEGCHIVFDLSVVRFLSSTGLGHIIQVGRLLDESGGALALAAGSRTVTRLLDNVGVTRVLPHFRTVREAVGYLHGRKRDAAS